MATFVINQSVFAADDFPAAVSKLRTKVLKLADNPALQQHGISEEEVALRFYVNIDRKLLY